MPNIGSLLKLEIVRLARKELRGELRQLKKAAAQRRRDVAALKREMKQLTQKVPLLEARVLQQLPAASDVEQGPRLRFSAARLRKQRKRQGLSAGDLARLVGVTQLSIYNWERGVARPRADRLAALAAVRKMSKREIRARLEQLAGKRSGRGHIGKKHARR